VTETGAASAISTGEVSIGVTSASASAHRARDVSTGRAVLGKRTFWLALAAVALIVGLALNWSWLVAAGVAPLLLSGLPCLAMCAVHLCAREGALGGCTARDQRASDRAPQHVADD
jgi:hypothetical protein